MIDLLVIGTGLAGLMAAFKAAKSGQRVKVVAKGLGALQLSAGTIDVLGYVANGPATAAAVRMPVQRPPDAVEQLATHQPGHPYALLGAGRMRAALEEFTALTREMGLPYEGAAEPGENLW